MRTRIVSAFPGCGRTNFYNNYGDTYKILDSDSSKFSWQAVSSSQVKAVRHPDFPHNYISHIKENIGKVDFILVSSNEEVREALRESCLFYYLCYPTKSLKDDYIVRYIKRGSDPAFISLLKKNFHSWIDSCGLDDIGNSHVVLNSGEFLLDCLLNLIKVETYS